MRRTVTRTSAALVCATALIGFGGLSACTDAGTGTAPRGQGTPDAAPSEIAATSGRSASESPEEAPSESPGPDAAPSPSASASRLPDPVMPTYIPVLRDGKPAKPRYSAEPTPFDETSTYPDGLSLEVVDIVQGKVTGRGPGVFPGTPKTNIAIRLTNQTTKPIDLNQVVVTAVYGPEPRQAQPVYDKVSGDFSGVVRPDRARSATYTFSIPAGELDRVTMYVDFDGLHAAATFTGSVR